MHYRLIGFLAISMVVATHAFSQDRFLDTTRTAFPITKTEKWVLVDTWLSKNNIICFTKKLKETSPNTKHLLVRYYDYANNNLATFENEYAIPSNKLRCPSAHIYDLTTGKTLKVIKDDSAQWEDIQENSVDWLIISGLKIDDMFRHH